jgi:hypothetical protein
MMFDSIERVIHSIDLYKVDKRQVENPFFAVTKVRKFLLSGCHFWPQGLEELVRACGADRLNFTQQYYLDRILEEISCGRWLVVTRDPFAPLGGKRKHLPDGHFYLPPTAPSAPEPLPPRSETPARQRVGLRIGLFFDGTYNNAANAGQGLLCGARNPITEEDLDASCKPYMRDPESSYGNGVSNIKLLHDLYPETRKLTPGATAGRRRIYVEGIGTRAGEADSPFGAGTGRGATGVLARGSEAFRLLKLACDDFVDENPDYEIDSLTFDLFGFSRGAAAARHFANQLAKGRNGPLGRLLPDASGQFSSGLSGDYGRGVQVAFIGLFDSVAATASLAGLGSVRSASNPLQLYLHPRRFPTVVHLVARDEYRANFALESTAPEHPELVLPGAHADLGGGYLAEAEECVLLSPMQALDVSWSTRVEDSAIYRDAERARNAWLARGWPAELLSIVTPEARPLPADPMNRLAPPRKRVYAALQLKRVVRGELSRVYLQVMHQLARRNGVNFDDVPDRSDTQLPVELQALSERFLSGDYQLTPAEERMLQLRYIHCSAHWNPPASLQGQTPRTGLALTFINAPTADGLRVRHPHA